MPKWLTTKQAADEIQRQYGGELVPDWKMRRTVDAMGQAGTIVVQRVQLYRMVDAGDISKIADELRQCGRLPEAETVPC